jgi:hypothetical protein
MNHRLFGARPRHSLPSRRAATALLVMLSVTAGCLTGVPAVFAMKQDAVETPWHANLVPCSPAICGGFSQNQAALSLSKGTVDVEPNGLVRMTILGLTMLSTGAIAANQTLEVHVGSFTAGAFAEAVPVLGTITTDSRGNFIGTIDSGQGTPFAFAAGTTISAQFILNEPGVRSDFITGFTVR